MSSTSGTSPATRRIARSYLTDLIAVIPVPADRPFAPPVLIAPVVEQLLDRAIQVRHVLRSDQLVLTFDLADDPSGWATPGPAASDRADAPADLDRQPENRDYPGQPGERAS